MLFRSFVLIAAVPAAAPVMGQSLGTFQPAPTPVIPTAISLNSDGGLESRDGLGARLSDADGVALAGVRALAVRTRTDGERRDAGNAALRAELAALHERLARLEALLRR